MKELIKKFKEKAKNCGTQTKEDRARKGAYVDCIIELNEVSSNYKEQPFSYDEMKRCAEFWNQGYIEKKYFDEFLKKEL